MAKQDDWIRITLRLPPELHEKLAEAAKSSSMNAEIVTRLEDSFNKPSNLPEGFVKKLTTQLALRLETIEEEFYNKSIAKQKAAEKKARELDEEIKLIKEELRAKRNKG